MVGHNPGLSELAQRFQRARRPIQLRTAGLCAIRFADGALWGELEAQLATVTTLLR
jgi:phosphohistidine phosphatase SixA